jgi:hypothetical protein
LLATTGPFESAALGDAIQATFARRGSHAVPAAIVEPPESWAAPCANMVEENVLRWTTLGDLTAAVRAFLDPVLRGDGGVWDPVSWSWRNGAGG